MAQATGHSHGHGHSHGLVERSIVSSREGLRAVSLSLLVLMLTTLAQFVVFAVTGSVALLADLVHNCGDALTAVPLGIALIMRSFVAEKRAGYFVVLTIFASACIALWQSIERLISPQHIDHLWPLAAAGVVGFLSNEIADPLIGLGVTLMILRITWQSLHTVRNDPGEGHGRSH